MTPAPSVPPAPGQPAGPGGPVPGKPGPGDPGPGSPGSGGAEPGPELHVLYVHFDVHFDVHSASAAAEDQPGLLGVLHDITPVVRTLPPDAALADVAGALRYFGRDAAELARLVRTRSLALYGVDCTVGVAGNPLLARMAAHSGPPGRIRTVGPDPAGTAEFLAGKPVGALPGVGPATVRTLQQYGLTTVGRVAATAPATLQRVLGAAAGRRLHERARGIDPVPVTPEAPARSAGSEYRFGRDELDPEQRRRALLTLADELGFRLRTEGRAARALTLTVRYADRSTTTRTRAFREPTAHTPELVALAYALHEALGLQRARVRAVALRAEELIAAELASRQLSFDPGAERARRAEAAADRARLRFGPEAVRPGGTSRSGRLPDDGGLFDAA